MQYARCPLSVVSECWVYFALSYHFVGLFSLSPGYPQIENIFQVYFIDAFSFMQSHCIAAGILNVASLQGAVAERNEVCHLVSEEER